MSTANPPRSSSLAQYQGAVPESALQAFVDEAFRRLGWHSIHVRDARRQHLDGWPDSFAVKGARIVAAELKRVGKHPTAKQQEWLAVLAAAGVEVYVWRPGDESSILEVLAR